MRLKARGSQREKEKEGGRERERELYSNLLHTGGVAESCIRNCSIPGANRLVEAGLASRAGEGALRSTSGGGVALSVHLVHCFFT
jgi:hypothetical protein